MREDVAIVGVQKGIAMHPELGRQVLRGYQGTFVQEDWDWAGRRTRMGRSAGDHRAGSS